MPLGQLINILYIFTERGYNNHICVLPSHVTHAYLVLDSDVC